MTSFICERDITSSDSLWCHGGTAWSVISLTMVGHLTLTHYSTARVPARPPVTYLMSSRRQPSVASGHLGSVRSVCACRLWHVITFWCSSSIRSSSGFRGVSEHRTLPAT